MARQPQNQSGSRQLSRNLSQAVHLIGHQFAGKTHRREHHGHRPRLPLIVGENGLTVHVIPVLEYVDLETAFARQSALFIGDRGS